MDPFAIDGEKHTQLVQDQLILLILQMRRKVIFAYKFSNKTSAGVAGLWRTFALKTP
jgi:hypothetical protein